MGVELVEHGEGIPLALKGQAMDSMGGDADDERGGLRAFGVVEPAIAALVVDGDDLALGVVDREGEVSLEAPDEFLLAHPPHALNCRIPRWHQRKSDQPNG